MGKLGCATCLLGSVVIVLHAPPDKDVKTINEILQYALEPGMIRHQIIASGHWVGADW